METVKKNLSETKKTINEIKSISEGIKSRLEMKQRIKSVIWKIR